jgi:hypothetical protein
MNRNERLALAAADVLPLAETMQREQYANFTVAQFFIEQVDVEYRRKIFVYSRVRLRIQANNGSAFLIKA